MREPKDPLLPTLESWAKPEHSPACLAVLEEERELCAVHGCPVLEDGRQSRFREAPYRTPEPPREADVTDAELAFWDRAAASALSVSQRSSAPVSDAALTADALLRERRKRFGVR